ncbi:MAG: hypothetical protein JNL98_34355 [Bryobacterales bacterium]|nr:hypothetical protein [Bryobacterales bacterium]
MSIYRAVLLFLAALTRADGQDLDYLQKLFPCEKASFPEWPQDADAAKRVSKGEVFRFLKQCLDGPVTTPEDVRAYRFVNMVAGRMYLVAVVPSGGTFGDALVVAHCAGGACGSYDFLGTHYDLDEDLVSISGDGVFQLVVRQVISDTVPYSAALYIYEIDATNHVRDASRKYQQWYTKNLYPQMVEAAEGIRFGIATLTSNLESYRLETAKAATQYAIDDYRERVLGEKDASLTHIGEWLQSSYSEVRGFAMSTLGHAVESPKAAQLVETMEKSSFEDVRRKAEAMKEETIRRLSERKPQ